MKVLITSAPLNDDIREEGSIDTMMYPLGLLYLHSILETKGHMVDTFVGNIHPPDVYFSTLKKKIASFNPDVVGINILAINRIFSLRTIEYVQKNHPNIKVVIGGIHTTTNYGQLVRKYEGIIAVRGEAEISFPKLLDSFDDPKDVKGIAYYKDGQVFSTPCGELVQDLDSLPFPKHELFFKGKRTTAYVLFGRGCPTNCIFCCLHSMTHKTYRSRSIENMMEEIDYLMKKYPKIETLEFSDDSLTTHKKKAKELMRELIKRDYNIKIRCTAKFNQLDEELVELMEKAGVHTVLLGLETGSEKIMPTIGKGITLKDVIHGWTLLSKSKIDARPLFMVGFHGETQETIDESIRFIKKMKKIKHFWLYELGILAAYPDTPVYEKMKEAGLINDNYWLHDYDIPIYTVEHSYDRLLDFKNQIIFRTMTHLDIFRFIASLIILLKADKGRRFKKDKLLVPILKKLFFIW